MGWFRRSRIVLVVIGLVVALAACSQETGDVTDTTGSSPNTTDPGSVSTTGGESGGDPIQITVWDQSAGWNDLTQARLDQFNAEQDEIEVEYVVHGADQYDDNVDIAFRTQQAPDVFTLRLAGTKISGGFVLPLSDLLSDDIYSAYQEFLEGRFDYVEDGVAYGVPRSANVARMHINKELFRDAGLDPDEPLEDFDAMVEAACAITAASDGEAFGFGLALGYESFDQWQTDPFILAGNPQLTQFGLFDMDQQEFAFEEYLPYIRMIREMRECGALYPGTATLTRDAARAAFAAGEIAMYPGTSLIVGIMHEQFESDLDWGSVNPPPPPGKPLVQNIMNAGNVLAIASTTENPEAAVKVLEILAEAAFIQELTKAGIVFPLHPDAQSPEFYPEGVTAYEDNVPGELDVQWPRRPVEVLDITGESYKDVLARLFLGDQSEDEILAELAALSERYTAFFNDLVEQGVIPPDRFTR